MCAVRVKHWLVVALVLMLVGACLAAPSVAAPPPAPPAPPAGDVLATLRRGHPRLLATAEQFDDLKQRVAADPTLRKWFATLHGEADKLLDQPALQPADVKGKRLFDTSRRVLDQVYTLGLVYRLTGDKRYAARAWSDLQGAGELPDWNPKNFLDTAEMTHAVAIGYDWLYDALNDRQRTMLRQAIVRNGLNPAMQAYRGTGRESRWVRETHNWNQVCNSGVGLGALAVADYEPILARDVLSNALASLPRAMANFAPDGAWPESPGYWNYATRYYCTFLAALQSALGSDLGYAGFAGFDQAADFLVYVSGPTGRTFNFGDGGDNIIRAPQMLWLARRFNRPAAAWFQTQYAEPEARDVLWYDGPGQSPAELALPLDRRFTAVEVATFREHWQGRDAVFVGFKAGNAKTGHSHLDMGTFVLDAGGQRFAWDLGGDEYALPGYFGPRRWTYYRCRAEGHNTLVINPGRRGEPDQDRTADAPIIRYDSTPAAALAVADLTAAYARDASSVRRGVKLVRQPAAGGTPYVLVQDEVAAAAPIELWWFMHTRADVALSDDGRSATLTRGQQRLAARLLGPAAARFTVMDARPLPGSPDPPGQEKNQGARKLAIRLLGVRSATIRVQLQPIRAGAAAVDTPPPAVPLAQW